MSGPVQRLKQVVTALTGGSEDSQQQQGNSNFKNPNALTFQAGIPKGLPVHYTPLNPVSFLLRSATVRPNRVAMVHPAKNASWTYAEWSVKLYKSPSVQPNLMLTSKFPFSTFD